MMTTDATSPAHTPAPDTTELRNELAQVIPDYIEIYRIMKAAGRTRLEQARAIDAALEPARRGAALFAVPAPDTRLPDTPHPAVEVTEKRARECLAGELRAQGFDAIADDVANSTNETYAVPKNIAIRAMIAFAKQSALTSKTDPVKETGL